MRQIQKNKRIAIDQIDIREVLDDLHISYREQGKNVGEGWIGVCCCFCDDQNYHLGINLAHKTINCFRCGTTGTIIKYLSEELKDFNKAITILGNAVPRELQTFKQSKENAVHVKLPKRAKKEITPYHAGYLQRRGFNYKVLNDKYNLHYCGPVGKWANRIIVPVIRNYKLITFTSIDISDDSLMRYKHLKDEKSIISIKHYLFGLEYTDGYSCCLVEGLFDQFRIGDGALATFGTTITSEQKQLLIKFQKIVIAFDGDKAGKIGGEKLANDLSAFTDVEILNLPENSDPDSLEREDIKFIQNKIGTL